MQIIALQLDIAWEDKPTNFRKVADMTRAAEPAAGTLLVVPEMFATGFSMNAQAISEPVGGPTAIFLSQLATQHRIFVIGGVAVREGSVSRNEALVFDPEGKPIARYAKMQPFTLAKEHEFYTAGSKTVTFDWSGCIVAPTVCYDLRFPEVYRRAALNGAEVLVDIANWPSARVDHWTTLLRARAIENQAYVVGVNRAGKDPYFAYPGRSLIIDPQGVILADGGESEGIVRADIDATVVRQWREKFPALRDVRKDIKLAWKR